MKTKTAIKTLAFKVLGCYVVVVALTSIGIWSLGHAIEVDKRQKMQYGVVHDYSGNTNYGV